MPSSAERKEKQQLKDLARSIVLSQGNDFIKQPLRQNQLKIGSTKSEFLANLTDAIDKNLLSKAHLDAWLDEVEGWGRQHVYFHEPPAGSRQDISAKVEGSQWKKLLNKGGFPEELTLTSIDISDESVALRWHRATEATARMERMDTRLAPSTSSLALPSAMSSSRNGCSTVRAQYPSAETSRCSRAAFHECLSFELPDKPQWQCNGPGQSNDRVGCPSHLRSRRLPHAIQYLCSDRCLVLRKEPSVVLRDHIRRGWRSWPAHMTRSV